MLRGLALADVLVVVPPGGADAGQEIDLLPLPW
jgi:molybdopterin molybdotransferase